MKHIALGSPPKFNYYAIPFVLNWWREPPEKVYSDVRYSGRVTLSNVRFNHEPDATLFDQCIDLSSAAREFHPTTCPHPRQRKLTSARPVPRCPVPRRCGHRRQSENCSQYPTSFAVFTLFNIQVQQKT